MNQVSNGRKAAGVTEHIDVQVSAPTGKHIGAQAVTSEKCKSGLRIRQIGSRSRYPHGGHKRDEIERKFGIPDQNSFNRPIETKSTARAAWRKVLRPEVLRGHGVSESTSLQLERRRLEEERRLFEEERELFQKERAEALRLEAFFAPYVAMNKREHKRKMDAEVEQYGPRINELRAQGIRTIKSIACHLGMGSGKASRILHNMGFNKFQPEEARMSDRPA